MGVSEGIISQHSPEGAIYKRGIDMEGGGQIMRIKYTWRDSWGRKQEWEFDLTKTKDGYNRKKPQRAHEAFLRGMSGKKMRIEVIR